jgi:hypothetical protein
MTEIEFSLVGSGPGTSKPRITLPKIAFNIQAVFAKKIGVRMPSKDSSA